MTELSTRFDFLSVEEKWCQHWIDNNIFHAKPQKDKPSYSIVIPPPNVTGILHMGHALNNTLQDIIIRYQRMNGAEACWMPGTDHAGIATQNVVEKQLTKEGQTRYDLGREELLKRLWAWKQEYGDTIIKQLKKLGSSCDWQRTRFTMDDHYSRAVREVFVRLYDKGLIYRGQYIINWCPRCQTALSDEEAEHRDRQGAFYHIRYPFKDDDQESLIVATTRPETMLGDTAVAVNPHDPRYKDKIGKTLLLPIMNREIPVIADDFVDPEFGTGAVKVTPAHDPNDFQMGRRHNLPFINILHPDGRLNEQAGEFAGVDRFEAREAIIEILKELKLLEKIDRHNHAVGHCYRCHTVVEPYLSKQWFVKMKPLAEPALKVVQEGKIKFYPERWTKVYSHWMENIRDWCISRQIWWGHRIPVWYCQDCPTDNNVIVSRDEPTECPHCSGNTLVQDEDVLDTWFSSWLWPFATFGWPDHQNAQKDNPLFKPEDLGYFYPTRSLFTASEIIFFWVARMVMAGLEFMGDIPFSDVYIHGTVRDSKGRKMSKSLGNALDPLEIIAEYGADALRFSLIINSGQDLYISKEKFEIGRNFANKIWNATRLVLMNTAPENRCPGLAGVDPTRLDLASRWILSRLYATIDQVAKAIEEYRFSEAENLIYEFFWRNFCDWYLEISKNRFMVPAVQRTAFHVIEQSLRLIHPFMPFVTSEIWEQLKLGKGDLSLEAWPQIDQSLGDVQAENEMSNLLDIVTQIRNLRVLWNIPPKQELACIFSSTDTHNQALVLDNKDMLSALLNINDLSCVVGQGPVANAASGLSGQIKFYLPLEGIIDLKKEKKRLIDLISGQKKALAGLQSRLKNKTFLNKAPVDVIKKEKEREEELTKKSEELEKVLAQMG